MAFSVAGEEGDLRTAQAADAQRAGRCAVGRVEVAGLHILQRSQPVDAGAADHGQGDVHRAQSLSA